MTGISNAAMSAALVAQAAIQNSANNVANAKTDGFKRMEVQTSDLFYNNMIKAGAPENSESSNRPVGAQLGTGSKIDGIYRILEQGSLRSTNNPLDLALVGPGYFAIALPNNKTGYTRNGAFQIDNERRLTTSRGESFADDDIIIDDGINPNDITISADGIVSAKNRANPGQADIVLGQLTIYTFANERGLESTSNSMLLETPASGEPIEIVDFGVGNGTEIKQKFLERSNVSTIIELTEMINNQRLYELALNFIKADSDMEKKVGELS